MVDILGRVFSGLFAGFFFGFLGYACFAGGLCVIDQVFQNLQMLCKDKISLWDKEQWGLVFFGIPIGLFFSLIWLVASAFFWGMPFFSSKGSFVSIICFYIAATIPLGLSFAQLTAFVKNREHFRNFNNL